MYSTHRSICRNSTVHSTQFDCMSLISSDFSNGMSNAFEWLNKALIDAQMVKNLNQNEHLFVFKLFFFIFGSNRVKSGQIGSNAWSNPWQFSGQFLAILYTTAAFQIQTLPVTAIHGYSPFFTANHGGILGQFLSQLLGQFLGQFLNRRISSKSQYFGEGKS